MENEFILKFIKPCIAYLYDEESMLFDNDLSERCIAFRFAYNLQNKIKDLGHNDWLVDCDYNSSTKFNEMSQKWERRHGKPLEDREGGGTTGRFIDVIVHTRSYNESPDNSSDIFCIEIKKQNNKNADRAKKDKNNLEKLTIDYGYKYGFHIIFGEKKNQTTIEIFKHGSSSSEPVVLFPVSTNLSSNF